MMSVSKIGTGNGKLDLTSEAQSPVNNLLKNHGFEIKNSANYFTTQISGSSAIINYSDDKASHTGNSSMSVKRTSSGENKVSQTFIPSFSVKSYTLSAWVKTEGDSQVRLGITQDSKNIYDNYGSASEWKKILVYFTEPISAGSIVYTDIYCKGTGTVYVDDIQISHGIYNYETNLIENGDFDDGITGWTTDGAYQITQYPLETKLS